MKKVYDVNNMAREAILGAISWYKKLSKYTEGKVSTRKHILENTLHNIDNAIIKLKYPKTPEEKLCLERLDILKDYILLNEKHKRSFVNIWYRTLDIVLPIDIAISVRVVDKETVEVNEAKLLKGTKEMYTLIEFESFDPDQVDDDYQPITVKKYYTPVSLSKAKAIAKKADGECFLINLETGDVANLQGSDLFPETALKVTNNKWK